MKRLFILFTVFLVVACGTVSAQQTIGLFANSGGSQDGFVLFGPIMSNNSYLIDKCGREVHQWTSTKKPGQSVYLLPDGSLLRPANANNATFNAGGTGGIIERYDWNSTLLWSYTISDTAQCQHHDVRYLPNGNILAIVWEKKNAAEAIGKGRNPSLTGSSIWSEKIVELHPTGTGGASIVWEWHAWDHLVQDYNTAMPAYDTVSEHPDLININYNATAAGTDWLHINSIDYNADLDQVMVSVHNFNEIWILDHSTTTAQAAAHSGGARSKGGDLLYRWGNAAAYNSGSAAARKLFGQHNAQWIANGLADSGKIIVFNNGQGRATGNYSSIDIITPPVDAVGNYSRTTGTSFQPDSAGWSYKADTPTNFYGANISGTQRLQNGNTLICTGPSGTFFEIDPSKQTVWKYINPVNASGPLNQGVTPTQNLVFRCSLYGSSYSGFSGHTLAAGAPIEINPLPYTCSTTDIPGPDGDAGRKIVAVNPFSSDIQLTFPHTLRHADIKLTGMAGNIIAEWRGINIDEKSSLSLSVPELPGGLYLLQVQGDNYRGVIKMVRE